MNNFRSKIPALVFGLLIVGIGVGYGLKALGIIDSFTVFFDGWWTVFIILPGLLTLFQRGSNKFIGLLLTVFGVCLLVWRQQWISASLFSLALPALAIVFGIYIIVTAFTGKKLHGPVIVTQPVRVGEGDSVEEYALSFGELAPDYAGKPFTGCRVEISFGKATLDLRQAIIESDCKVELDAGFSGVEIFLPPACRLVLDTSANFGNVENQFISSASPDAPAITLEANAAFSGVVIR